MYTRIRRTVCALFLICILLLQACPVSALGSTQVYTMTMQYATLNECEFQAQTVDFSTSHLFRDQLSDVNQTSLYDLIVVSTPASGSIVMTASDLPDFPATTSSSFESVLVSFITDTVLPAYAAAVMDTPMLF